MNARNEPSIIIVGAGPAGCACALMLAQKQIPVTLLEKATFPRDKICGDALSPDVMNQLKQISEELAKTFFTLEDKFPIYGGWIITSDAQSLKIPLVHKHKQLNAYICPRMIFDNFLFEEVSKNDHITVVQNCQVNDIVRKEHNIILNTSKGIYQADMLIGADGAQSVVARYLQARKLDKKNYCAGLRVYYEHVSGFYEKNYVELFFFNDTMPGYLWIFPMNDGKANVGIGMLSSHISQKKINLKVVLQKLIETHPQLKDRFKNAKALESIKGFGLPLGSKKRRLSGDRYVLTGDAASLIDPFSGEGIGNAIRSGRVAADHVQDCIAAGDYSADFNKQYDDEIYRRMWSELNISRRIQRLLRYPVILEYCIKKINRNKKLRQFFMDTMEDKDQLKKLLRPGFYWELLTKG